MTRRRCCCEGAACVGSSCCSCEADIVNIAPGPYVLNLGTVESRAWTWGFVSYDRDLECSCTEGGTYSSPCWNFRVDKCAPGEFDSYTFQTVDNTTTGSCDACAYDNPYRFNLGTVTAVFPLQMGPEYAIGCKHPAQFTMPSGSHTTLTWTGFLGHTQVSPTMFSVPGQLDLSTDPVSVGASFAVCKPHPCNTWIPNEYFGSEPMCTDCSDNWDIVTVAYVIRDRATVTVKQCLGGGLPDCAYTADADVDLVERWTALVRYVRKPVCVESGGRDIRGQYAFACAEIQLPLSNIWFVCGCPFPPNVWDYWYGQGRHMEVAPSGTCVQALPDPPCYPAKLKLCNRIGFGFTFPEFVTIT